MASSTPNQVIGEVSLNEYFAKVDSMSREEYSSHMREDYRDDSQVWPDYLDFIEDWKDQYFQKLNQTRKHFVYAYLASFCQTLKCGNHSHIFSCFPLPQELDNQFSVVVPTADSEVDTSSCWYKTLIDSDSKVMSMDVNVDAPRLSVPEATLLRRLTQLNLARDAQPPVEISFSEFKKNWWTNPTKARAFELVEKSTTPSYPLPDLVVERMKSICPMPSAPGWTPATPNFMRSIDVMNSHGFHNLIRSRGDRFIVLEMINNHRQGDYIDPALLSQCIQKCRFCKTETYKPIGSTPPGLYYAPPGNGKTTCLAQGIFVGIDTDWLSSKTSFTESVSPFLQRNIPVITNIYDLCLNAGERAFGTFNVGTLRKNEVGKPYTNLHEIIQAKNVLRDDLSLLYTEKYFVDTFPILLRMNHVYNIARGSLFPSKRKIVPPQRCQCVSVPDVLRILSSYRTRGRKHRTRQRARSQIH